MRSRTVDDYSDVPRYEPFFTWTSWQWRHERDATLDGADLAPKYADPRVQTGDGGAELQRFAPSSQHTLHVGPAGAIDTVD